MTMTLHYYPGYEPPAKRLAAALGLTCQPINIRSFPDGESLVRVSASGDVALVYCSLDHADAKLFQLLLSVAALRDSGAAQVILIAPYLGYMRQDTKFAPGEAVSQRVIGKLIASTFDGLVTVDPHLHRTPTLEQAVPGIPSVNVAGAPSIANALVGKVAPDTILVGPDEESQAWVAAVANPLSLEMMVGAKQRIDDCHVEITLPDAERARGRPVLLVDDMISSGGTLAQCAEKLRAAGAMLVGAITSHCLARPAQLESLRRSGVASIQATDTIPGPLATIAMAEPLAEAVIRLLAAPRTVTAR